MIILCSVIPPPPPFSDFLAQKATVVCACRQRDSVYFKVLCNKTDYLQEDEERLQLLLTTICSGRRYCVVACVEMWKSRKWNVMLSCFVVPWLQRHTLEACCMWPILILYPPPPTHTHTHLEPGFTFIILKLCPLYRRPPLKQFLKKKCFDLHWNLEPGYGTAAAIAVLSINQSWFMQHFSIAVLSINQSWFICSIFQ